MKNHEHGKNQQKLARKLNGNKKTEGLNSLGGTKASLNWLFKGFSMFHMNSFSFLFRFVVLDDIQMK